MDKREVAAMLSVRADEANDRLTELLDTYCEGRSRLSLKASDYAIPGIKEALREQLDTNDAWLTFLYTSRL